MIPKIIHQTWKTEDLSSYIDGRQGLGGIAVRSQNSLKELYSDFEYKFWTDEDIKNYLQKQPKKIQDTFKCLNMNIKKMDFFRYLILHEHGGLYCDMDFVMFLRFDDNILNNNFIGYKACRNHRDHYHGGAKSLTSSDEDGKWVLGNAFFGCEKGSSKIKKLINAICSEPPAPHFGTRPNPLCHTGPERMHEVFVENNFISDTFLFPKSEIDNNKGTIAAHFRNHRW